MEEGRLLLRKFEFGNTIPFRNEYDFVDGIQWNSVFIDPSHSIYRIKISNEFNI